MKPQKTSNELADVLRHTLARHTTSNNGAVMAALVKSLVTFTVASRSNPESVVAEYYRCLEYTTTRWCPRPHLRLVPTPD